MKKGNNIIIIVVVAVLLITIVGLVLMSTKRYDWYETYEIESKEPYGAYIIGEMLKNYYPEKKFTVLDSPLNDSLAADAKKGHKNYISIGSKVQYDSTGVRVLLSFVEQGNTAFISTGPNVMELLDALFPDTCLYYDEDYDHPENDSIVKLNFYSAAKEEKTFTLTYVFQNKPFSYAWMCFDSSFFCGSRSNAVALGYFGDYHCNFIKMHYGNGDFYIHSIPLAFSNYSLTKKENLEYVSKVFSFVPPGDILWDEYSKFPGNLNFNSELESSQSPLRFILSQEGLRWAWYLSLLFLLLYVIFFGKRRQRIIPLAEPNTNTSLEYINIIGQLYYQAQGHKTIGLHKMKLFQSFIRNRYFINVGVADEQTIQNISLKSQIPVDDIKNIFREYNRINTPASISSEELITFHNLIENFYKHCK